MISAMMLEELRQNSQANSNVNYKHKNMLRQLSREAPPEPINKSSSGRETAKPITK